MARHETASPAYIAELITKWDAQPILGDVLGMVDPLWESGQFTMDGAQRYKAIREQFRAMTVGIPD